MQWEPSPRGQPFYNGFYSFTRFLASQEKSQLHKMLWKPRLRKLLSIFLDAATEEELSL